MCNLYFTRYIYCEEGHYQVRLPFRNQSLAVPANRCQAERRALSLKVNSSSTPYSKKTDVTSLENVIQEGFAEKVPSDDLYIADDNI